MNADTTALRDALEELAALVRGECPRLLDEDSGGDAALSQRINDALSDVPKLAFNPFGTGLSEPRLTAEQMQAANVQPEQFADNAKKSTARSIRSAVVLHLDADGTPTLKVWDPAGEVLALWIDEAAPGDRVYEERYREPSTATLRELIGEDRLGHSGDGHLDDQTVQGIRAAFWRGQGGRLAEVPPDDEASNGA